MERIVTLGELKELRERLVSSNVTEEDKQKIISFFGNTLGNVKEDTSSTSSSFENTKTLVKTNPNAPSLLEKTPPTSPTLFDKAGFSNVIYLATISLVFEVVFLAISFLIYK